MVAASPARAVVAAALALTSDLGAILVVSSLLTAGNAFGQPVELALIAAVAGRRPLTEATGVHEAPVRGPCRGPGAGHTTCRGAATAGAARQRRSFVAIAAAASAMRVAARPARRRHASATGTRRLSPPCARDRVLRVTIAAAVGALLFISTSLTVESLYIKNVVGASDTAYALLVCASMAAMVWEPPPCPGTTRRRRCARSRRPRDERQTA